MSNADELLKLKKLLDSGVLTEEEFNSEKNKILGEKPKQNKAVKYKTENLVIKPNDSNFESVEEYANIMGGLITLGLIGTLGADAKSTPPLLKTYRYLEDMRLEIKNNKIYHRWEYTEDILRSERKYKQPYIDYVGDVFNTKWKKSIPLDEILEITGGTRLLKTKKKVWANEKPPTKKTKSQDMFQEYVVKGVSKTIRLYVYFRDNYFIDEIINFEKKLFKAMKECSANCPKCSFEGLRPATRIRDCLTCQWRYENLKNI